MDENPRTVDTTHWPPPCAASTSSNSMIGSGSHHSFEITSRMRYSLVSIVSKFTRPSLLCSNAPSIQLDARQLSICVLAVVGHGLIFPGGSHPATLQKIPAHCTSISATSTQISKPSKKSVPLRTDAFASIQRRWMPPTFLASSKAYEPSSRPSIIFDRPTLAPFFRMPSMRAKASESLRLHVALPRPP